MPLNENEELELLRLQKAKFMATQKPALEGGNVQRFAQGALESVGQAGVGLMQAATELVAPTPMFGMKPASGTLSSVAQPVKDTLTQTVDASQQRAANMGASGRAGQLVGNLAGAIPATLLAGPQMGAEELAALTARGVSQPVLNSAGKVVGPVARTLGNVIKNAAQGGVAGAQQAVGSTDSRVDNAALDTVLGGAVGTAAAGLKASKGALDIGKRVLTGRDADTVLADVISRADKNPQELLEQLKGGQISGIADIAGDDVQGLTRSIGKTPLGKNIVSDALEGRSLGAVQRVTDHLSKDVSDVGTYFGNLDDIAKARGKMATPLYKQAFEGNPVITSAGIDDVLQTPAGKAALKQAGTKMQNDMTAMGTRDIQLERQAKLAGIAAEDGVARGLNLRSLDYVKRSLDDQIGVAQRAGEADNVRVLTGLKNRLLGELDAADVTGQYPKARQVFAGFSKLKEAQEMGVEFDSKTPEQLRLMLKEMTPGEKDAFRIGVREKLQRTVSKTPDGADPAKRIMGNTQKRFQLQEVFENPKRFVEFQNKLEEEINAARTKFRVLGGSRTDYNIGADDSFEGMVDKIAKQGVKHGLLSSAIEKVASIVKNRYLGINADNAKLVAKALVDREEGIKTLERLMKMPGTPESKAAEEALNAVKSSSNRLRDAPDPRSRPLRIDIRRRK